MSEKSQTGRKFKTSEYELIANHNGVVNKYSVSHQCETTECDVTRVLEKKTSCQGNVSQKEETGGMHSRVHQSFIAWILKKKDQYGGGGDVQLGKNEDLH